MTAARLAPAKVNLFLHVGPPETDGFHPLASWAGFADVGDRLTLEPAAAWSFRTAGEFGAEIGPGENLVERAVRALFKRVGARPPPLALTLEKRLPVASGLGGGTIDAAAALKLVAAALPEPVGEEVLQAVAAELGADGPVCLAQAPTLMQGRGERLSPAPRTPPLPVVLVNPRRPSPTGAVYRRYDDLGASGAADAPDLPAAFDSGEEVAAALAVLRNDLEPAAVSLEPAIGEALALVRAAPESLLTRMSGSGATVFALCADAVRARSLALRLRGARPEWWVSPATLSAA